MFDSENERGDEGGGANAKPSSVRGRGGPDRLTAALVRNARELRKYHDGGGLGLYLRVEPNGTRF